MGAWLGEALQANQGEVLDDYCYVTSALKTLHSKSHIITFVIWLKQNK